MRDIIDEVLMVKMDKKGIDKTESTSFTVNFTLPMCATHGSVAIHTLK